MISRFKTAGFTLIELLLVFSIVALLMSLVAPLTFKTYDNMLVRSELSELNLELKKLQKDAYFLGGEVEVLLHDHLLEVMLDESTLKLVHFEHLRFPEQSFRVTALPVQDVMQVVVFIGEVEQTVEFRLKYVAETF